MDGTVRRIGLVGGMSWESSAVYYRLLNEGVRARLGGLHSAECILYSIDFARVEKLQVSGQWKEAAELLAGVARAVETAGAEVLLLCTNTMHKVADEVAAAVKIPLLHLGDATAERVLEANIRSVGLLGTAFTMEGEFYRARLEQHGLAVVTPEPEDRELVHRVIYEELCRGIVREASRARFLEVIARLVGRGAGGIILGCTEIELLVDERHTDVPLFPTTRIHVEAALDWACGPDRSVATA